MNTVNQIASDLVNTNVHSFSGYDTYTPGTTASRIITTGYDSSYVPSGSTTTSKVITSYGSTGSLADIGGTSYTVTGYGGTTGSSGSDYYSSKVISRPGGTVINSGDYVSKLESAIINASAPLQVNEAEEITINGHRGAWANKDEVATWSGIIPITQYAIHNDPNPEVITKRTGQAVEYLQELGVRYLRPPTPPPAGELIIREESGTAAPPAPPIIIRQRPPRPPSPEPLIIREAPPTPPAAIPRKVVTIKGKMHPPPPRKVIIEKLPALPAKPQSVIVEKWLPYKQNLRRRVIYQRAQDNIVQHNPRNLIIQWEPNQASIRKEYKFLGVVNANPAEYVSRYGTTLKRTNEIPNFISEVKVPDTLLTTIRNTGGVYELEGDLEALNLIDLDREGLAEYRSYLSRVGFNSTKVTTNSSYTISSNSVGYLDSLLDEVFSSVDTDRSGVIDINEASRLLMRLNSKLGRSYGDDEVRGFFRALDTNGDGRIDILEFKRAFRNIQ